MEVAAQDAPAEVISTPAPESFNARDAGKILADIRWKKQNPEAATSAAETPAAEPAQENLAESAEEAAPATEQPSGEVETEQQPEPEAELPPIEPPRSWTSEAKERFASLPRDTQEYIAQREQDRERELRRSQNEHAEKLKGLTAKEQQAEQARQQYEQALPTVLQVLQEAQQGEFADIKTIDDVTRLAKEDWPRYALWDAQQKKIAAIQQEMVAAKDRQQQEFAQKWNEFSSKEDALFLDAVPEMKDAAKAKALTSSALDVLKDTGFNDDELSKLWSGQASVSLRDHRIQRLVYDAIKLREAKKVAAQPAKKPLPPVIKPGSAGARTDQGSLEIRSLQQRASETPNARNMASLLAAQRKQREARPG